MTPNDAVSTIATQAFMGRRPDEFRPQLIAALKIIEERHATRAQLKSSWAGAMGYTQFMPKDFEEFAVDFDGDGKRDIWNSIPELSRLDRQLAQIARLGWWQDLGL